MNLDSKFTFGLYEGATLRDVWTGKQINNVSSVIREFLKERLEVYAKDYENTYLIPGPISEKELNFSFKHKMTLDSVVSDRYIILEGASRNNLRFYSKLIKDSLALPFSLKSSVRSKRNMYSENSNLLLDLLGNPGYIAWCINNVDDFFIEPDGVPALHQLKCKFIKGLPCELIKLDLIEYKVKFDYFKYSFPDTILDTNLMKYNGSIDTIDLSDDFDVYSELNIDAGYYPECPACSESPCMCSDPF